MCGHLEHSLVGLVIHPTFLVHRYTGGVLVLECPLLMHILRNQRLLFSSYLKLVIFPRKCDVSMHLKQLQRRFFIFLHDLQESSPFKDVWVGSNDSVLVEMRRTTKRQVFSHLAILCCSAAQFWVSLIWEVWVSKWFDFVTLLLEWGRVSDIKKWGVSWLYLSHEGGLVGVWTNSRSSASVSLKRWLVIFWFYEPFIVRCCLFLVKLLRSEVSKVRPLHHCVLVLSCLIRLVDALQKGVCCRTWHCHV